MHFKQRLDLGGSITRPFVDISDRDSKLHLITVEHSSPTSSQYKLNWVDSKNSSGLRGFNLSKVNTHFAWLTLQKLLLIDVEINKETNEISVLIDRALVFAKYLGVFAFNLTQ